MMVMATNVEQVNTFFVDKDILTSDQVTTITYILSITLTSIYITITFIIDVLVIMTYVSLMHRSSNPNSRSLYLLQTHDRRHLC